MTKIYVDADACPVKSEVERVATRHKVPVLMVADGGLRPSENPLVQMVFVEPGLDAADNWIAAHIGPQDICITNDIPLASRCLKAGAAALRVDGTRFTDDNIGSALATRDLMQSLRETGQVTGGPKPFSRADRSNFLNALENTVRIATRATV